MEKKMIAQTTASIICLITTHAISSTATHTVDYPDGSFFATSAAVRVPSAVTASPEDDTASEGNAQPTTPVTIPVLQLPAGINYNDFQAIQTALVETLLPDYIKDQMRLLAEIEERTATPSAAALAAALSDETDTEHVKTRGKSSIRDAMLLGSGVVVGTLLSRLLSRTRY